MKLIGINPTGVVIDSRSNPITTLAPNPNQNDINALIKYSYTECQRAFEFFDKGNNIHVSIGGLTLTEHYKLQYELYKNAMDG